MRRLAIALLVLLGGCGGCGGCGSKDTMVPTDMPENAAQKRERRQREAWAAQGEKSPEPQPAEARPFDPTVDSGVPPPPPRGDERVAGGFYDGLANSSTGTPPYRQVPEEKALAPSGPSGPHGR